MRTDAGQFSLVTHVVRKGDGQGRVNLEVVREALRQGVGVHLFASEIDPELQRAPLLRWTPVRPPRFPSHLLREMAFSAKASRFIREHGAAPLVANGCVVPLESDLNACHFVHSAWLRSPVHSSRIVGGVQGRYQKAYSWLNSRWEKSAYRKARIVVAVSDQVRRELVGIGIDPERIQVVPNGVDSVEFSPGIPDRKRFGLPENVPLALFAGDIRSPRKNLDTVLRALAVVDGLRLVVAGSLAGSPFPAMATRLGVADRVHFLGKVGEMPLLMRSCDLFVFPSRYEACSLVMLEAMASGLPVLTSRTTGGSELVPMDGGYLLDGPDDLDGVATSLRRAISDPVDLASRSVRARVAAEELTWAGMGSRYLDLLGLGNARLKSR